MPDPLLALALYASVLSLARDRRAADYLGALEREIAVLRARPRIRA